MDDSNIGQYDMILGRGLLTAMGLDLDCLSHQRRLWVPISDILVCTM